MSHGAVGGQSNYQMPYSCVLDRRVSRILPRKTLSPPTSSSSLPGMSTTFWMPPLPPPEVAKLLWTYAKDEFRKGYEDMTSKLIAQQFLRIQAISECCLTDKEDRVFLDDCCTERF